MVTVAMENQTGKRRVGLISARSQRIVLRALLGDYGRIKSTIAGKTNFGTVVLVDYCPSRVIQSIIRIAGMAVQRQFMSLNQPDIVPYVC